MMQKLVIRSLFIFGSIWAMIIARHNNEVYPLPSEMASLQVLGSLHSDEDFDELRNFFMKNVDDSQICHVPEVKELIVKKDGNGIGWWGRRCSAMSGGVSGMNKFNKSNNSSSYNNLKFNKKVKKRLNSLLKKSACQPVKTVVKLEYDATASGIEYVPCSVQVRRCSGCCNSEVLDCKPAKTKVRTFTVLGLTRNKIMKRSSRSSYSMPGDSNFLHKVKVTEHLKCECQCKETAADCTPTQKYHPHLCKCLCPEETKKHCQSGKQVWSEESCSCVCSRRKECTTGMSFNTKTCSCELEDSHRIPYFEYGK